MADYPPPLDVLLTLGPPEDDTPWPRYREYGLAPGHIPDLIRMVQDQELYDADPESPLVWASMHAWRTLGQLHAESADEALLQTLQEGALLACDLALDEIPEVFALIGPGAIPSLQAFLADSLKAEFARGAVAHALELMAAKHWHKRDECVGILTRQLELMDRANPALNGTIVESLVNLEAVESAPAIQKAFGAGCIDDSITGSWRHVEWDLGLAKDDPEPLRDKEILQGPGYFLERPLRDQQAKTKAKAKRKQAAKSRKRNRKRK